MFDKEACEMIVMYQNEMKEFQKKQEEILKKISDIEVNRCLFTENEIIEDFRIYVQRMDERILKEICRRYEYRDLTLERMKARYNEIVKFVHELKNSSYDKEQPAKLRHLFERHKYYESQFERLHQMETKINKVYQDLTEEYLDLEMESQKKLHNLDLEQRYFAKNYALLKKGKQTVYTETTERMTILAYEGRKVLKVSSATKTNDFF